MRRIHITEAQFKLLMEDACYLNKDCSGSGIHKDSLPFIGNEVRVAAPDSTTEPTTDKISNSKANGNPLTKRNMVYEEELDDQRAFIGKNGKEAIMASSGKMANNIKQEMNGKGSRLNTTEVRLNRLEKERKNDPLTFAQNGGKAVVNALKTTAKRQRMGNAVEKTNIADTNALGTPNVNQGHGKGNHKNTVYYDTEN